MDRKAILDWISEIEETFSNYDTVTLSADGSRVIKGGMVWFPNDPVRREEHDMISTYGSVRRTFRV